MGSLRTRIRAKIARRNSASTSASSACSTESKSLPPSASEPSKPHSLKTPHAPSSIQALETPPGAQPPPHAAAKRSASPSLSIVSLKESGSPQDPHSQAVFPSPTGNRTDIERPGEGKRIDANVAPDRPEEPDKPDTPIQMHSTASDHLGASDMIGNDLPPPNASAARLCSIDEHSLARLTDVSPFDPAHQSREPSSAPAATVDGTVPGAGAFPHDDEPIDPLVNPLSRPSPLSPELGTPTPRPFPATRPTSNLNNTPVGSGPAPAATSNLRPAPPSVSRPDGPARRQSLLPTRQTTLIRTLLSAAQADDLEFANPDQLLPISANMVTRKIWVKRPGASATLITINEDDLVDDVREMILRKYANSLGRHFDAPDLTLRIVPREQRQERTLGPEEPMGRTLDAYFPGGQTVDEALVIDVPLRRTPRASPRTGPPHAAHIASVYYDEVRPSEGGTDYFGPGAIAAAHLPVPVTGPSNGTAHPHAISVLSTGQVPQIPSPGGTRPKAYRERPERPRLGRQHTSSPTILNTAGGTHAAPISAAASHGTQSVHSRLPRSRAHSNASSDQSGGAPPAAPPIPTPPAADAATTVQRIATPPPRVASPRPTSTRPKKKKTVEHPSLPPGMLNGGVPPINVLIVEDNIINLKLLEAFVKRLKVRWQTAMNGREAVNKWRAGGFHLVLMDIQLPVMSGLDATREIRRLERVNSIGVFSSSASSAPEETNSEPDEQDRLVNTDMFKSPVIIVALTASSLQSDRHEALAAGCNDFLTKPVNFVWLERKVMEWGCMQALIDFDGWRKWKDFSQRAEETEAAKKATAKAKTKKNRQSLTSSTAG